MIKLKVWHSFFKKKKYLNHIGHTNFLFFYQFPIFCVSTYILRLVLFLCKGRQKMTQLWYTLMCTNFRFDQEASSSQRTRGHWSSSTASASQQSPLSPSSRKSPPLPSHPHTTYSSTELIWLGSRYSKYRHQFLGKPFNRQYQQ